MAIKKAPGVWRAAITIRTWSRLMFFTVAILAVLSLPVRGRRPR